MPQVNAEDIPHHAEDIAIGMCADPKCGSLHVVLFKEGKPFCAARVDDLPAFLQSIQDWAYIAAVRRSDPPKD